MMNIKIVLARTDGYISVGAGGGSGGGMENRYTVMEEKDAEITRLRAELATARRDAMEELERHFREAAAGTPLGHEDHQRGASTYNWLIYCATTISAIKDRAAAGEQAHITKDQQAVFEDALTNSVKIITEKGCAVAGEGRQRPLMHLDPSDTRTHIIDESGDLVGLQDKSEKEREP